MGNRDCQHEWVESHWRDKQRSPRSSIWGCLQRNCPSWVCMIPTNNPKAQRGKMEEVYYHLHSLSRHLPGRVSCSVPPRFLYHDGLKNSKVMNPDKFYLPCPISPDILSKKLNTNPLHLWDVQSCQMHREREQTSGCLWLAMGVEGNHIHGHKWSSWRAMKMS